MSTLYHCSNLTNTVTMHSTVIAHSAFPGFVFPFFVNQEGTNDLAILLEIEIRQVVYWQVFVLFFLLFLSCAI